MKRERLRQILDFVPLFILAISAITLIWNRVSGEIGFQWKHILGLLILPINFYLFKLFHKLGIITLGATLLLGLVGIISYSPAISISSVAWTPFDLHIPIFYGQPIFLFWLILHLIISARYYFAMGTKKYWVELQNAIRLKRHKI